MGIKGEQGRRRRHEKKRQDGSSKHPKVERVRADARLVRRLRARERYPDSFDVALGSDSSFASSFPSSAILHTRTRTPNTYSFYHGTPALSRQVCK